MAFNKQQLVKDYKEAFGHNAALPIAFWHSDTPIADPEKTGGCFIPVLEDVRCTFVSEKEHYKASAELVERAISQMDIQVSPYKYINFQRLDLMDEGIDYYGVLIFATPDILSGLVSWAYFDNASQDAVAVPWGSGCSATIRAVIRENELMGRQCFIGFFDPSVRPHVNKNELMFAIPKSRLEEMAEYIRDTCLFKGKAWPKVRERE